MIQTKNIWVSRVFCSGPHYCYFIGPCFLGVFWRGLNSRPKKRGLKREFSEVNPNFFLRISGFFFFSFFFGAKSSRFQKFGLWGFFCCIMAWAWDWVKAWLVLAWLGFALFGFFCWLFLRIGLWWGVGWVVVWLGRNSGLPGYRFPNPLFCQSGQKLGRPGHNCNDPDQNSACAGYSFEDSGKN